MGDFETFVRYKCGSTVIIQDIDILTENNEQMWK